ncbi:MAG: hypothetical protein OXI87_23060 [Albidovulum sp.]|nr:hypothetical protein [Albidovulum sp.]
MLDNCPDRTTICGFQQMLVERGLDAWLPGEVKRQLSAHVHDGEAGGGRPRLL